MSAHDLLRGLRSELRDRREKAGLSRAALVDLVLLRAPDAGVDEEWVRHLENGRRTMPTRAEIEPLLEALGMDWSEALELLG